MNKRNNIKKDLEGFSGIYLWLNINNNKYYIGSADNLYRRISNYFQPVYLKRSYPIYLAINKYGLNNFKLIILDILGKTIEVSRNVRLKKEDYYLSLLLPEYNILDKGSSYLNYKHSLEVRMKILRYALSRDKSSIIYSKEFKKQQNSKWGINNHMYGKTWSEERKKKVTKSIYVYDSNSHELLNYFSGTGLAIKGLKMGNDTLSKYLKSKKPFKGKLFSRIPIFNNEIKKVEK
jgi:group I intron endonuclease